MARRGFDYLALFDELFVISAALDELECPLFLDDLRGAADVVALTADGPHQARALYAAGEFANGRKRAFVAAFLDLCIDTHRAGA